MPGYRGRLIWPRQARIERIDTAASAANLLAGQPSGYDRIFREPVRIADGTDSRVYLPATAINCQVMTENGPFARIEPKPGGRELSYDVRLALHYADIELAGLIAADGSAMFQPSDRLVGLYQPDGVTLIRDFSANPLYCNHVQDRSYGLSGRTRNLLLLYFKNRTNGV